jgi:hypothetical protein
MSKTEPAFELIAAFFDGDPLVTRAANKGFGSGALKVNDKIFASMSRTGKFIVKLPEKRVDELIAAGKGERFNPTGKVMKEWLAADEPSLKLAREAYNFVKKS